PCFVLLEAAFEKASDGLPTIVKTFKKALEFVPTVEGFEDLHFGLSSLESNAKDATFVAATPSEKGEDFKTAFWIFSRVDGRFTQPKLLRDSTGKALVVTHKVEGIVFESEDTLLAICDDDRALTTLDTPKGPATRKPNEAAYFRIKLSY